MTTPYRDEPARPKVEEDREELLERVRVEQEEVLASGGRDLDRDPSTRRGFTRLLLGVLATGAIAGYAITLVVVGVLRGWEQGVQAGFAGALVLAVISALLLAEGEDGRIARWVDARARRGRERSERTTTSGEP